jgi:hypothetical protein
MILVPAASLDDWKKRLADPEVHLKTGDSTDALAARWHGRTVFPREISELLTGDEITRDATLLLAIPEHQVPLASGARASHLNLWLLARARGGLLSVVIEAIGTEGFDPAVRDQKDETGTPELWGALCRFLEIEQSSDAPVRSRLLHRTATALLEARRFFARGAAVIVHSFSQGCEGFGDFQHFVRVMGGRLERPGQLVSVAPREGIEMFFGWAQGPVAT